MLVLNLFCVSHIQFYHVNWLQAFQVFQSPIFQVKMVNQYEFQAIFKDIEQQLSENVLHHFLHNTFFMKSSLN